MARRPATPAILKGAILIVAPPWGRRSSHDLCEAAAPAASSLSPPHASSTLRLLFPHVTRRRRATTLVASRLLQLRRYNHLLLLLLHLLLLLPPLPLAPAPGRATLPDVPCSPPAFLTLPKSSFASRIKRAPPLLPLHPPLRYCPSTSYCRSLYSLYSVDFLPPSLLKKETITTQYLLCH